jgi:hypothetical protein
LICVNGPFWENLYRVVQTPRTSSSRICNSTNWKFDLFRCLNLREIHYHLEQVTLLEVH